jgi:hypothetical protein
MKKLEFTVNLEGKGTSGAWWSAPFDVIKVFGTRARVPVPGTINGFAFRSSLMAMGGCHGMAINKSMRDGAGVKAGDAVSVVMERARRLRLNGKSSRLRIRKRSRFQSARLNKKKPAGTDWRRR